VKSKILRAIIEMGFIIFLFYSNLLMGEYKRSNNMHVGSLIFALEEIFTFTNFAIAVISAFIGHIVFGFLRKKF
jgi:hypothetical protein